MRPVYALDVLPPQVDIDEMVATVTFGKNHGVTQVPTFDPGPVNERRAEIEARERQWDDGIALSLPLHSSTAEWSKPKRRRVPPQPVTVTYTGWPPDAIMQREASRSTFDPDEFAAAVLRRFDAMLTQGNRKP